MISKISQTLALLALVFVLAASAVVAQPGNRDGGGHGKGEGSGRGGDNGKGLGLCLSKLELTQEQKDAIADRQERAAAASKEIRANIEELNKQLREAKAAGNREEAAEIMEQIKAQHEAHAAIERGLVEAILALLTPEQLAELKACTENRGRGDNRERKDCFSRLELTDAQKAAIKAIHQAFRAEYADEMQELRELHKALRAARRAGDDDEVARLRAEIETKMVALKAAQQQVHADVLAELTEEQRAALEDCQEDRHGRRGRGRGGDARDNAPKLN